jgi:hypothetical protein
MSQDLLLAPAVPQLSADGVITKASVDPALPAPHQRNAAFQRSPETGARVGAAVDQMATDRQGLLRWIVPALEIVGRAVFVGYWREEWRQTAVGEGGSATMQDDDEPLFDRYETPFDEPAGGVAELDARLDPLSAGLDRLKATTDQMQARLDRIEATLDRMDARLNKMITKWELLFWGIVLTLEITACTLIVACWR